MELQNSVKLFLNTKHIVVPDDWIVACIDWVFSDNPQLKRENKRAVSEKVFEQWLYSDLTELGTSCLPLGLTQQRLTTISGYFPVQVNHVRDVGQPAYAQLQKVQKADTQNASVSAEQQHQPIWEPKPSRMLLMQITDGTSVVCGMEYCAIPILSLNIKPGAKILLFGSITSRRGTLLLRQEQVQMLGGEVEALRVPNAVENILARCLRLEENENPQEYEETCDPTQTGVSQASQYYPSQMSSINPRNHHAQPLPPPPAMRQAMECMREEVVVKGFIMTLVSRMEQTAGRWYLRVLINDSTASREVDIASEVLEELIGLSVEEHGKKKAEAKSNSEVKAVLAKKLSGCQQKLISLCCLLHLHLDPSLPRPILTAVTQVTPSLTHHLHLRSSLDAM